jgi:tRNA(Ile)-lysidine synthase
MIYQQVAKQEEDTIYFDLKKLKNNYPISNLFVQWLKEFEFTAWEDI